MLKKILITCDYFFWLCIFSPVVIVLLTPYKIFLEGIYEYMYAMQYNIKPEYKRGWETVKNTWKN